MMNMTAEKHISFVLFDTYFYILQRMTLTSQTSSILITIFTAKTRIISLLIRAFATIK